MKKKLKAVLFDMDGVLFNSMPYHYEAWHKVMKSHGLTPVSYTHLDVYKRQAYDSFEDPELRYRQRYVDLVVNDGVKETLSLIHI